MLKSKLNQAIVLAIAANAVSTPVHSATLEEVVVTATKRTSSLQDVAVSIQALNGEKLEQLNVANFDDYIRYLPGVNAAGRGPGQSSIFIRGMATDSSDQTSAEIGSPVPNVALYLDEQPASSSGRNLDVYAADIERVEVLPGPQGTVFGASSQAGTIRLITNKPVIGETLGGFDASFASTKGGELSNSVEAFINIPVNEKLAVRGVVYNATEGGYIDNVFGENSYREGDAGFPTGATSAVVNNLQFVEEDFNDTNYKGFRLSAKYAVNDDWEVLAQFMNQTLDVDGVFDHSPESVADLQVPGEARTGRVVGDLQVQRFFKDSLNDEFDQLALTVKGRMGALDLVYAGSFLDREVNNSFDYSGYTGVGPFGYYYICQPTYTACGDPTQGMIGFIENERQTHELRINSDGSGALNYLAGIFYDDIETRVDTQFVVPASTGFFAPNAPHSGSTIFRPNPRPQGVTFVNDAIKTEEQLAIFGEISYDFTDKLSATLGARRYDIESSLVGSSSFATLGAVDGDGGRNYDEIFAGSLPLEEKDTIFKATVEYNPSDDVLLYVSASEGFRPGGFNRTAGVPATYLGDQVTNYEFGWKTTLLDGSLRFNGAAYFVDWEGVQVGITDFDISVITFISNAADAEIKGVEGDVVYAATDNLTLTGAFSYNDTEMVNVPANIVGIAPEGSQLALAPEFQFNIQARYEWEQGDYSPYAQVVLAYTDDQFSSIVLENRFLQDSYTTLDASLGAKVGDSWGVELFGENLTDERAELFINSLDTDLRVTTNRPRTVGVRVSYDF